MTAPALDMVAEALERIAQLLRTQAREVRLVSLQEVASRLSVDETLVRREIARGSLPAQHVGGRVLIRDVDLAEYIQRGHELGVVKRRRRRRAAAA